MFNSEAQVEVAFAYLGKLLAHGVDARLLGDGKIDLDGPVTDGEIEWCRRNRDALRAALVGAGRYERGTLDRIYEIGGNHE